MSSLCSFFHVYIRRPPSPPPCRATARVVVRCARRAFTHTFVVTTGALIFIYIYKIIFNIYIYIYMSLSFLRAYGCLGSRAYLAVLTEQLRSPLLVRLLGYPSAAHLSLLRRSV